MQIIFYQNLPNNPTIFNTSCFKLATTQLFPMQVLINHINEHN